MIAKTSRHQHNDGYQDVVRAVGQRMCSQIGVPWPQVIGRDRSPAISWARAAIAYVLYDYYDMSFADIASVIRQDRRRHYASSISYYRFVRDLKGDRRIPDAVAQAAADEITRALRPAEQASSEHREQADESQPPGTFARPT